MTAALMLPRESYESEAGDAVARWGTVPATTPSGDGGDTAPTLVVAIGLHKHNGVLYYPGQQYTIDDPAEVARQVTREAIYVPPPARVRWWDVPGRVLSPFAGDAERVAYSTQTLGALRIVQGVGYDPGSSAYRLHSALGAHSKHASAFVRFADSNPHCTLRQYDGERDAHAVRGLLHTADVIHCHVSYLLINNTGMQPRPEQTLVMHYHGSRPDGEALCAERMPGSGMPLLEWDVTRGAHVVGARLTLVHEIRDVAERLGLPVFPAWLPITVDVARYRSLRPAIRRPGPFRIAHSPTERSFKGTDVFRRVCARLEAAGLQIEPVLIERRSHGDALAVKADCDAVFDSFWLGMQGSGLEGAAMGLPVIAGDPDAAREHRALCGQVPWTYANGESSLSEAIERLATDPAFCAAESARVGEFVHAYHDYPAVARRYETLLGQWTGRGDTMTTALPPKRRRR